LFKSRLKPACLGPASVIFSSSISRGSSTGILYFLSPKIKTVSDVVLFHTGMKLSSCPEGRTVLTGILGPKRNKVTRGGKYYIMTCPVNPSGNYMYHLL
jgi:hypothetical protein